MNVKDELIDRLIDLAFAEDIVKNETNIDECTIIMRELFHEVLDQRRKKELSDKIVPPNKT